MFGIIRAGLAGFRRHKVPPMKKPCVWMDLKDDMTENPVERAKSTTTFKDRRYGEAGVSSDDVDLLLSKPQTF